MYIHIKHKDTFREQVVRELTDFLFQEGWRMSSYVHNSDVNIHEVDENERVNALLQYDY